MKGFFTSDKISKQDMIKSNCIKCGLNKKCNSPKLEPQGNFKKNILIINSMISPEADEQGRHIVGEGRRFLIKSLDKGGIDLNEDCLLISAICCKTDKGSSEEVALCRNRILKIVKERKPEIILTLGLPAVQSLLNHRYKDKSGFGGIGRWRGWQIPDQEHDCWICPTYHLDFSEQDDYTDTLKLIMEKDIINAVNNDKELPEFNPELDKKHIQILTDEADVNKLLRRINNSNCLTAFDYETSGLKPYTKGHFIKCVSICWNETSYAFLLTDGVLKRFKEYLNNNTVGKIAGNIKYEDEWSKNILGTRVEGWVFDTVLGAHILDNRTGITSVKFQACVNLGVMDYASSITPYLISKSSNDKNRINEAPVKQLLEYCALDSYYEMHIAKIQMDKIKDLNLWDAYDLFHDGSLAFSDMEDNGFYIDEKYITKQDFILDRKITRLKKKLEEDDTVKKWKRKYGQKFNIDSNLQLADILYNDIGVKPTKFTDKGNPSTDKEALAGFDLPFIEQKSYMNKLQDAKDTFLHSISVETFDGRMHPSYNLNTVCTYRGSCNNPNGQNFPIRDPEMSKLVRSAIFANFGNIMAELDFTGAEVISAHCYHQDPVMFEYLTDKTKDMHRDVSIDCYLLEMKDMINNPHDPKKLIRYSGKNRFTFPQFYGSYFGNCAKNLWKAIDEFDLKTADGTGLKEHLRKNRIKNYTQFKEHIKDVENTFWNKRFKIYTSWKKKWYRDYIKKGYFDTLTGFRCTRLMGFNDAINYPPQGTAFHFLLWCLIEINQRLKEKQMETKIMGQIHDSIIADIVPEEKDEFLALARQVMTKDLSEHWKWITVPIEIEVELTEPGESWFTKKEIEL